MIRVSESFDEEEFERPPSVNHSLESPASPLLEPTRKEFSPSSPLAATLAMMIPGTPLLLDESSEESARPVKPKTTKRSILLKILLIGGIVVDYVIDLFNRSSRDFREVSRKLAEMKSDDKLNQHERLRNETTTGDVCRSSQNSCPHRSSVSFEEFHRQNR